MAKRISRREKLFENPRYLVFIFLVLAVLMISSSVIEFHQNKEELLDLMEEQSHSLLETLSIASRNSIRAGTYLEAISTERLLNNATIVKLLYEQGRLSNAVLEQIAETNNIFRINIFDRNGNKIFTNHPPDHFGVPENNNPKQVLQPIFSGEKDTLLIGLKQARFNDEFRFVVAIAARDRSVIVLNLNATNMLEFRNHIGFGVLLRNVIENPGIVYVALQDSGSILAASGNVDELQSVTSDPFLHAALRDTSGYARIIKFRDRQVYEAVHSFAFDGRKIGLFRLGISLTPLESIYARMYRRLIIITVVLLFIGTITFTIIFARERYNLLNKQYQVVETYSGNIIRNVSDAIIVLEDNRIRIFNQSAEVLFGHREADVTGKTIEEVFPDKLCGLLQKDRDPGPVECLMGGRRYYLLVSSTSMTEKKHGHGRILVIRDLTDQKILEMQMQRTERLSAMGELASGVAHEIRNPLNTIGTIVQQMNKDFEPRENRQEYHELADLVYKEVRRINDTVKDFLRFARPEPIQPEQFALSDIFDQLQQQYASMLQKKNTDFQVSCPRALTVTWDRKQMQQVLMNLIQNAAEAVGTNGKISLRAQSLPGGTVEIIAADNGPGIKEEIRSKIFNLYFTTKASGTGIGLSVVQRIVYEHGGMINAESEPGSGTRFILHMPLTVS